MRVDRIELSKNLLRGFLAFDELLGSTPEWRERVVFAASVYPSREGLPEYLAYRQEVETRWCERINERWATRRLDADPARRRRRLPPLGGRCCGATTCCWSTPSATG